MNHRTSIFRPLALTFLMALPFGFGVGFLAVGVYEGWLEFKREVLETDSWATYHNHSLGFLTDGTPVVRDHKTVGRGQWQDQYKHLDGKPITQDEREEILHPQYLRMDDSRRRHPFDKNPFENLLSDRNRWWGFRDPEKRSIEWTWEPVEKSRTDRVLVARYQASDAAVWFVTPDGFVPGTQQLPESAQGFELPKDWRQEHEMVAFLSAGKLTAINLVDQTVATITNVDVSRQAWSMFRQNDETGWRFAVQTPDMFRIYSACGEQVFALSTDSREFGQHTFYAPTDGSFIVTYVKSRDIEHIRGGEYGLGRYGHSRIRVAATWMDKAGDVTRTLDFQHEIHSEPVHSSSPVVNSIDWFMESIGPGLVAPEPAVICGAVYVLIPWISSTMFPERPVSEAIDEVLRQIPYAIPVSAVVALFCAIACWRRQQKYQADWTKTWVTFVFLFGLPAWIAWRVHRRWPPIELATISEADFIGPVLNGLEIR